MYGGRETTSGVDFSFSTMWILGLELKSGLVASTHPLGHLPDSIFFFKLGKPENDGGGWRRLLLKCF